MTDHILDATKITRDEIVELVAKAARNSDSRVLGCGLDDLGRLIEVVRADEREECAKIAEDKNTYYSTDCGIDVATDIADAIRARSKA